MNEIKNKAKIVHVTRSALSYANRMLQQCRAVENEYYIHVISYNTILKEISYWRDEQVDKVFYNQTPKGTPRWKRIVIRVMERSHLVYRLLKSRPDIVHVHEHWLLWLAFLYIIFIRKPIIYDAHDMDLRDEKFRRNHYMMSFMERYVVKRASSVICVSNGMIDLYKAEFPEVHFTLLRNIPFLSGSSHSKVKKAPGLSKHTAESVGNEKISLIYAGLINRLRLPPGFLRVIGGYAQSFNLDIYGKDISENDKVPYLNEVLQLIEAENYGNIRYLGPYKPDEIISIMEDYHFHVFPYDIILNIDYCMPNKFYQSLMAGLPIIASNMKEIGSIIHAEGIGVVYDPTSIESLKETLNSLSIKTVEYEQMRHNVARYSRELIDFQRYRKTLLDEYTKALK